MNVSLNEAAKLIKKSKSRVLNDLKNGNISGNQDPITKYWSIPLTEIYRFYGNITGSIENTKSTYEKSSLDLVEDQLDQITSPNKTEATLIQVLQDQLSKVEQRLIITEERLEVERLKNDRLINQLLITHQPDKKKSKSNLSWVWVLVSMILIIVGYLINQFYIKIL